MCSAYARETGAVQALRDQGLKLGEIRRAPGADARRALSILVHPAGAHGPPRDRVTLMIPGLKAWGTSASSALSTGLSRSKDRWLRLGFWAVADQGLFACSNFILNVLLARWLVPQEYGTFVTVYAVFALVGVLHDALLVEPMLIFGPAKYRDCMSRYMGALLYGHLGFSVLSGAVLLAAGTGFALAGAGALSTTLLGLAATGPLILFFWLVRRACYARFIPYLAAFASVVYMTLMLAGAYLLYSSGHLSPPAAFALMGGASLISGALLVLRLGASQPQAEKGLVREVLGDHLGYGRWSTATRATDWIAESSYLLLLPLWGGLGAAGAIRALINLIMPVVQAYSALATILLPTLVRARGSEEFRRTARFSMALFVGGALVYWIILGLVHRPLISWLYDGRYTEYGALVWALAALPLLAGVGEVLSTVLRALGGVHRVFWAGAAAAAVCLTLGICALFVLGVTGAVVWLLSSQAAAIGVMVWSLTGSRRVRAEFSEDG